MNKVLATLTLLLLATCAAPEASQTREAPERTEAIEGQYGWSTPSATGPVLIGIVRDPHGAPLANIQVTPHGGFATRFPGTPVQTDELGRYRFDPPLSGSMMQGDDGEMSILYIGVCVGSVSGVNPAAYLPWADIRVKNAAHVVERLDFTFDPESVPLEVRD